MALLEVASLHAGYGNMEILSGIDLEVDEGGVAVVLGPNGAGKTTLLRGISGTCSVSAGSIIFAGAAVRGFATYRLAGLGIGHVAEGLHLFTEMTVRENLDLGAQTKQARAGRRERLEEVFGIFPRLEERERQRSGTLSGGERQMLAIGRALMGRPQLLLLDEPSAGLSPLLVGQMIEALRRIAETGTALLLVEQFIPVQLAAAAAGYVLRDGQIIWSGSLQNLLDSDLAGHYLG